MGLSEKYVAEKFFTLTTSQIDEIYNVYGKLYGSSAQKYFLQTYQEWKYGLVTMSDLSWNRMLACVPKLLDTEELVELVLAEVKEHINLIKNPVKKGFCGGELRCDISNLQNIFRNKVFQHLKDGANLRWFTKEVLTEDECKMFNNLAQFVISEYFIRIYEGAIRDLMSLNKAIVSCPYHIKVSYYIEVCNIEVQPNPKISLPFTFGVIQNPPQLYARFEETIKSFLLDCKLDMQRMAISGKVKRDISMVDISMFEKTLKKWEEDKEPSINLTLEGESGIASVDIKKLDIVKLKKSIYRLRFWQVITFIVTMMIWYNMISKLVIEDKVGLFACILFIFFVGFIARSICNILNEKITEHKKDIKHYGKNY